MRKIYAVTAAILAAGCLASSATAAPDPIKTLNRKVTALEKQVKTLRTDLGEAQATLGCLGPIYPIARYAGYLDGDIQSPLITTALDQPESTNGLTPAGITCWRCPGMWRASARFHGLRWRSCGRSCRTPPARAHPVRLVRLARAKGKRRDGRA